ncbi:hypothetical protein KP78_29990 [Jeotgalibacillus soli]|uniref:Uncharacterized protein n=1 Tax=Jeotgalibacillus soli TaxID=889306 RepID=A0A0C2R5C3_9BACL|nr:hypothetical protein KP78_29990 [Jeotgalibacillus soli]
MDSKKRLETINQMNNNKVTAIEAFHFLNDPQYGIFKKIMKAGLVQFIHSFTFQKR